jgi:Ca2+-transporting ATPase
LVHDDFSSIVSAVRLGRRIYDNIKKAMIFVIAVHIPIIGLSMLPVFFGDWPLILLPVHIVFLELIIDPSCSLIFEAEEGEGDLMRRPPRRPTDRLFSTRTLFAAVGQGFAILITCLAVFFYTRQNHSPDAARALTFSTLVAGFLTTITANRSWSHSLFATIMAPNAAFRWVIGGTALLLAGMLTLPIARQILHFDSVHLADIAISLAVGVGGVLIAALALRRVLRPGV